MLDLSGVNSFLVYPKTSIPKREDENKKAEKDVVLVIRIELKKLGYGGKKLSKCWIYVSAA